MDDNGTLAPWTDARRASCFTAARSAIAWRRTAVIRVLAGGRLRPGRRPPVQPGLGGVLPAQRAGREDHSRPAGRRDRAEARDQCLVGGAAEGADLRERHPRDDVDHPREACLTRRDDHIADLLGRPRGCGQRWGPVAVADRELLSEVCSRRADQGGDANIGYLSGLDLFGAADAADLPDDLHPNTAGYRRMGERFLARVLAPGKGRWAGRLAGA